MKSIFITGATGLIGVSLIAEIMKNTDFHVIACVRNKEKAEKLFGSAIECGRLSLCISDLTAPVKYDGSVDFVVHGASNTSSKAFVEQPVDVIGLALDGTRRILEFARAKKVESFVYLSSMEVYGTPETDDKIFEDAPTNIETMNVRSSYAEGKRMCETICKAYQSQYGVPVRVARLTQTLGSNIDYNDGRVFAEFARCAIEKRNIVLKTKGETKRCYLYEEDAAKGIMAILLRGENGEAYNVANEETYCSIYEMAQMVCRECANGEIEVVIQEDDITKFGYLKTMHMNLETSKLKALGWEPTVGLAEMFNRLIKGMKESIQ